jgi:hypothetical protein
MRNKHSLISAIAAGTALLVLAGCGGGGEAQMGASPNAASGASADPRASAGATPADAFAAHVEAVIADTSETAEPRDVGSYQATTPESTEPSPLG